MLLRGIGERKTQQDMHASVPSGQCVAGPSTVESKPTCLAIFPTTTGGGHAWANSVVTGTEGAHFAPYLGKTLGWAFEDNGPKGGMLTKHFPPDGKLRGYRSRSGGNEWEALTNGLPQSDCYVNVLRDAMAVDSLDKCGVYFGTTGGQVYASADAGDTWAPIVRDLPPDLSVKVQTLR